MIKKSLICLLSYLPLMGFAADDQTEFLKMIVVGQYDLIGKTENPEKAYAGKVNIVLENDQLLIKKQIDGEDIIGKGAIESAAGGDARVLRIRYVENSRDVEQTCLVHSDLNNYARISCHSYATKEKAKRLGMEALFHAR